MQKGKQLLIFILCIALVSATTPVTGYAATRNINVSISKSYNETAAIHLIKQLFSEEMKGIDIKNPKIKYNGSVNCQVGSFSGAKGEGFNEILSFDDGIALSTGDLVKDLTSDQQGIITGAYNDKPTVIRGEELFDIAYIEFDLVSNIDNEMLMQYAFASEEYMKYSNSNYNDRFELIVNDKNYAYVPGTNFPIAIKTINQNKHTKFFRPNDNYEGIKSLGLNTSLNGLTKTFTSSAQIKKGVNHIKIMIGDLSDNRFDSVLFIKAKSFKFVKSYEPGQLSVNKVGDTVVVKRSTLDGSPANSGTIGFTLVMKNLDGLTSETEYLIEDGQSEVVIPIAKIGAEDQNSIPSNTKVVTLKDPQMGASIGAPDSAELKLPRPELSKIGPEAKTITAKGLPNATLTLYQDGAKVSVITLDSHGVYEFANLGLGQYTAEQTKGDISSDTSNRISIVMPPTIMGDFSEVTVPMVTDANLRNYDVSSLNVKAQTAKGTAIPEGENFSVVNLVDKTKPGAYTIKWTAKDSGFTTVKTKFVNVQPPAPKLFDKDYKDSFIEIKGLPNAVAVIYVKGVKRETIQLDTKGYGKFINPPNGEYSATQQINGVESAPATAVNINRTFTNPIVKLINYKDGFMNYGQDDASLLYGHKLTFGDKYIEYGATANDKEDDKMAGVMSGTNNTFLTPKITIDNPMLDKNMEQITVINPAINPDGTPIPKNTMAFKPFVGKYYIKYSVIDTDDMYGDTTRLVRVYPPAPTTSMAAININSAVDVDALSSASVYLYDKDGNPLTMDNGQVKPISDKANWYKDGVHLKIKMPSGATNYDNVKNSFSGLPDGEYTVKQRLYGLNSQLSPVFKIKRPNHYPKLILKGLTTQVMKQGKNYVERGYTVSDEEDDIDLSDARKTTHNVDSSELNTDNVGRYKVVYTAIDSDNNKTEVKRTIVVKPKDPVLVVGNYIDGVFTEDKENGNDVKLIGSPGAIYQIIQGHNGQGGLTVRGKLDKNGQAIIENLAPNKTKNGQTTLLEGVDEYACFQTIDEIQSDKIYFDIYKTNNPPMLDLKEDGQIIKIEKGDAVSVNVDNALSEDEEDGNISDKILIYKAIDKNAHVIGEGYRSVSFDSDETNAIKTINVYYQVKDTDGNKVMRLRQIAIHPKAPILSQEGETICVTGLEPQAKVTLYKINPNGTKIPVDAQTADLTGKFSFTNLETANYCVKQAISVYDSKFSDQIAYSNSAFIRGRLVDDTDAPLKDVRLTTTDNNKLLSTITDTNGSFVFGVESADKQSDIAFMHNEQVYSVFGTSSEDPNMTIGTAVVGSVTLNQLILSNPNISASLFEVEGDKLIPCQHAKIKFNPSTGTYMAVDIKPLVTYKVKLIYTAKQDLKLPLGKFNIRVNSSGVIKIMDYNIAYGQVVDNHNTALEGVKITLYNPDRDGNPDKKLGAVKLMSAPIINNNINGSFSDANGQYAYMAYDGVPYVVVASKEGYEDKIINVKSVDGQLLTERIEMCKKHGQLKSDCEIYQPKAKDEIVNYGQVIDLTNNISNLNTLPEGTKVADTTASTINTTNPGTYKGEITVTYPDGTKDVITTNVIVNKAKLSSDSSANNSLYDKGQSVKANSPKNEPKDTYVNVTDSLGKALDQQGDGVDKVDNKGYLSYKISNEIVDAKVVEQPKKGKVLVNSVTGDIIYLSELKKAGKDTFKLALKDKNGVSHTVNREVVSYASDNTQTIADSPSMVVEVRSNKRSGFVNEVFNFTVAVKNKLGKDVKDKKVYVVIPDGFVATEHQGEVKDNVLILNIKRLNKDQSTSFQFKLKAVNGNANMSEVYVMMDGPLTPLSVSLIEMRVYEIGKLYQNKPYVKGFPNGRFSPRQSITRAEVAAMLTRCMQNEGMVPSVNKVAEFSDVHQDAWYAHNIDLAVKYGLFEGFNDGTFKPQALMTRAQLAQVMANRIKLNFSEAGIVGQEFLDTKEHWAKDEIKAMRRRGVVRGYEDSTFRPDAPVSRAETVKMINQMFYRHSLDKVNASFNDLNQSDWSFGNVESAYRGYSLIKDDQHNLHIQPLEE